jgi:phosphoglycolate phosphatase
MTAQPSTVIIFDFDGTLADSMEDLIAEYNRLAPRFRVQPLAREDLAHLRTLGPHAALKAQGVSLWKLPLLVHAMRSALRGHVAGLEPFPGIAPALRELSALGARLAILSTNSTENINGFLARHDLSVFEHVAGGSSMFGKARALQRLISKHRFDPSQTWYVGDEVRDIAAASAAGVRSASVGWGYGARSTLVAHKPDRFVEQPGQLPELLRL